MRWLLALLAALLPACSVHASEPNITVEEVAAAARLVVESDGGSVSVAPGPPGKVRVEARRRARTVEESRALEVWTRKEGDTVRVRFAATRGAFDHSVDFVIHVPPGTPLEVRTGGGALEVRGPLRGRNRLSTGGGSIRVAIPSQSRLRVRARTGGGACENQFGIPVAMRGFEGAIGDGADGSLELETGGGSISLARE